MMLYHQYFHTLLIIAYELQRYVGRINHGIFSVTPGDNEGKYNLGCKVHSILYLIFIVCALWLMHNSDGHVLHKHTTKTLTQELAAP